MFKPASENHFSFSELMGQCKNDCERATEVAGNKILLQIIAKNRYGMMMLIHAHGKNPEFAKALLTNSDIMYEFCQDPSAIETILDTNRSACTDAPISKF